MSNPTALLRALAFLALLGLVVLFAGSLVEGVKRAVPIRFPK